MSCANTGTRYVVPKRPTPYANATIDAPANGRWRNSRIGSSGAGARISQRTNTPASATPAIASAIGMGAPKPARWPATGTFSSVTSAPSSSIQPIQSKRCDGRPACRGSVVAPSARPAMQNGTVSRKIERQPNASRRTPPIAGPMAGASTMPKPYSAIARPRSSTGYTRKSTIMASGCNTPAHAPCTTRAAISHCALELAAASSDAARNSAIVPTNVERSPIVSTSHAVASIVAVVAARKPAATHCSVSCPTRNSAINAGNATLMMVAARIVEIVPIIIVVTILARDGVGVSDALTRLSPDPSAPAAPSRARPSSDGRFDDVEGNRPARELERQRHERVPRVALAQPLGERIERCQRVEQPFDLCRRDPPDRTFECALALAPPGRAPHGGLRRLAERHGVANAGQCMHVLGKLPDGERDRLTFVAQRVDDAQRPAGVTREPCFGQFLDVETRDVGDGALDVLVRERALRQQ